MTVTPSPLRLRRRVAVVATAAAMLLTFAVPQAASAHGFASNDYTTCVSGAITTLVDGGQVVKRPGAQGVGFYTVGGDDYLGADEAFGASVATRTPGVWVRVPICG